MYGFGICGLGFGLRFRVSVFGFRVSGFRCRVSGFGCRVLGFVCRVWGFRFLVFEVWGLGLGFRV